MYSSGGITKWIFFESTVNLKKLPEGILSLLLSASVYVTFSSELFSYSLLSEFSFSWLLLSVPYGETSHLSLKSQSYVHFGSLNISFFFFTVIKVHNESRCSINTVLMTSLVELCKLLWQFLNNDFTRTLMRPSKKNYFQTLKMTQWEPFTLHLRQEGGRILQNIFLYICHVNDLMNQSNEKIILCFLITQTSNPPIQNWQGFSFDKTNTNVSSYNINDNPKINILKSWNISMHILVIIINLKPILQIITTFFSLMQLCVVLFLGKCFSKGMYETSLKKLLLALTK